MGSKPFAYAAWLCVVCGLAQAQPTAAEPERVAICGLQARATISAIRLPKGIDSLTLFESMQSTDPDHFRMGTAGEECATARKRAACDRRVKEVAQPTDACREHGVCPAFAIVTIGDRVLRVGQPAEVRQFLELPVDSAGEALILALLDGFQRKCFPPLAPTEIRASPEGLGFELRSSERVTCAERYARAFVSRDGAVKANSFKQERQECVE